MNNGHLPNQIAPSKLASVATRSRPKDPAVEPGNRKLLDRLRGLTPEHVQQGPWWTVSACLAGLVLAIAIAGFVALTFNHTVSETTEGALRFDIALQDDADDLRVAILDVRHYHRNLMFYGPTNDRLIDFHDAYAELQEEIDELESMGINEPGIRLPAELRQMAEDYYAIFQPALAIYYSDPDAFELSSNDGLIRLAALEREARLIDRVAELQADLAVDRIVRASANARLVLFIVVGGLILVGAALILVAGRVFAEVRRLYEAEQAASTRLGDALEAKSNFVADISHELRTPLTVVRGNAEAGLAIEASCDHREILEEIVGESARMTRLVEDLLFLARSDADAPPLEIEPVAVEPALEAIAERAEVLAFQRGASLSTALTAKGTVDADAARIEQAVLALVDNAAKFSPPGETVRLSSSTAKGELIIDVADHGPGIPEGELALIFERFYRADKARRRRRGGAGLGLSIARTIVEAHGGRIEAQSRLGSGTRMRIYLPLVAPASPALPVSIPTVFPELVVEPATS